MVVVLFEKGAVGSLHHHVHRQISYVAAGKFEVTIDGKQKLLEHGVVLLEEGSLVDVFTPSRDDFL